ncbi:MAG: iron ABC transporter permease [Thermodesulfovibrionales bacterium]|nr:iron ABC transporter permease [Thermodesulfovibrionales bacterium]
MLILFISSSICSMSLFIGTEIINPFDMDALNRDILYTIRLPRILTALLIGIALGASGAILQGILRNPLADPYILGISSGASFMAIVGIVVGTGYTGLFSIPFFAFTGAVLTGAIVGSISYKKGIFWHTRLLLAGIGVGFLFSALVMLILSTSAQGELKRSLLWMFGELSMSDWGNLPYGFIFISSGLLIALSRAKALNSLMLGDELAWNLGYNPSRERLLLFISVCLMVASSVSLGGTIGFIGLLMPHIVRMTIGTDNRLLIPFSALLGGTLLCLADMIGRTVFSPMELPAGIITALIGAPYFLYLLRRKDIISG